MSLEMPRIAQKPQVRNETSAALGQRMGFFRKRAGLSQAELAQRLGVLQEMVSAYERGRVRLHADILAKLAEVFGVSTDEILGLKESEVEVSRPSRKFLRRVEKIESLPAHQQQTILRTLDLFLKEVPSATLRRPNELSPGSLRDRETTARKITRQTPAHAKGSR